MPKKSNSKRTYKKQPKKFRGGQTTSEYMASVAGSIGQQMSEAGNQSGAIALKAQQGGSLLPLQPASLAMSNTVVPSAAVPSAAVPSAAVPSAAVPSPLASLKSMVAGGKGKRNQLQQNQNQNQNQDGGNLLTNIAVPAVLLYANNTLGKRLSKNNRSGPRKSKRKFSNRKRSFRS